MRLSAGAPDLGATWDGRGTNFALFSAAAEKVELCLFDASGECELERIALPERTGDIWHGHLSDVEPGRLYGYRVHGPYQPVEGLRFNANKLLLDPYAKKLAGSLIWNDAHLGYRLGKDRADLSFDRRDNARWMPKAVVFHDDAANRQGGDRPSVPWEDTIIYEAHVKGLTRLREDVPPAWRGRFRGLAAPAIVDHLKRLGVTTLELLPVHAFIDEMHLFKLGLSNYWGYNTLAFFVPAPRYAAGDALECFRTTVARLHDAGIEVVLDVVYNHTAEGDHLGPTLSFRGIDNASYYRLRPGQPRYYDDLTGCGNALNVSHPQVLRMVMDSLRYWVEACHVDGFRFDLATTLARGPHGFSADGDFFGAIRQDPVLACVKLIAEPWDIGPGGYRAGNFPAGWSEWNDQFRKTVRRYWTRKGNLLREMATRMNGSPDLFNRDGRTPQASINHVTVHDGFTLADLVSFQSKHNASNGEGNRDGADDNQSTNCGVEGPTEDRKIVALRRRLRRNLLASLLLARGVPLLLAGDEVANSQGGNNNAYCQDNPVGWVDWSALGDEDDDMTGLIAQLTDLRRRFPQLRAPSWGEGGSEGPRGILWLTPQGTEMMEQDWIFPNGQFLAYVLGPLQADAPPLCIVLNAAPQAVDFTLPVLPGCRRWTVQFATDGEAAQQPALAAGASLRAPATSVLVFSRIPDAGEAS
jgi:glycogen operon protein